jgi:hypothetical protein
MGGIVARCAMNSLVAPRWFPEHFAPPNHDPAAPPAPVRGADPTSVEGLRLARPHAGDFERIDLVTVDTPWSGFIEPPVDVRNRLERESSFVDLVSNSALMASLHATPLPPHFTVNHIEADNAAGGFTKDVVVALCELEDEAVRAIARFMSGDGEALRGRVRLQNQLRALLSEEDYPRVADDLRDAARAGALTSARFVEIIGRAVPRFAGSHTSVLDDPELAAEVLRTLARDDR